MRRHSKASSAAAATGTGKSPGRLYTRLGLAVATALALLLALAPAALAANRAYELVSPANKGGADVESTPGSTSNFMPMAAADGSRVAFTSLNAIPGSVGNLFDNTYEVERGATEWKTSFLTPGVKPLFGIPAAIYEGLSEDLSKGVFQWGQEPKLSPEAPEGVTVPYIRNNLTGTYRLLTPGAPAGASGFSAIFVGGSKDLSRVVLFVWNGGQLTSETPASASANPLLYEWSAATGALKLVAHLPDNTVLASSAEIADPPGLVGSSKMASWNSISTDASHIFYTQRSATALVRLYVRVNATTTKWVSEPKTTTPDPNGERDVYFRYASTDGSKAFFTSAEKLTDDATTGPTDSGSDLYRWDEEGETLTDITVDGTDANGAEVQGVLGGAANGSDLYFVAKGVLAPGATAGENNLYVWREGGSPAGTIKFIASGLTYVNWLSNSANAFTGRIPARVSRDGSRLTFAANTSLTGYPNAGFYESYIYDANSEQLVCATCNPSGAAATGDALAVGTGDYTRSARTFTADGQHLFFTSPEQLVPADTNAVADTYEYDAENGEIALISSGKAELPSVFSDASENGSDVIFTTRQRLVGIDQDENTDAYDARVGGGIAGQNPVPGAPPCSGQECRVPTEAFGSAATPASEQLTGPGNRKPRHKHKKKHHTHKRSAKKPGNANRHANR